MDPNGFLLNIFIFTVLYRNRITKNYSKHGYKNKASTISEVFVPEKVSTFLKRKNNIKNYCNYYHYYYYHYFWKWTLLVNSRGSEANNYNSFYFYVLRCIVIHQNQNSGSFILFCVLIAVCCS